MAFFRRRLDFVENEVAPMMREMFPALGQALEEFASTGTEEDNESFNALPEVTRTMILNIGLCATFTRSIDVVEKDNKERWEGFREAWKAWGQDPANAEARGRMIDISCSINLDLDKAITEYARHRIKLNNDELELFVKELSRLKQKLTPDNLSQLKNIKDSIKVLQPVPGICKQVMEYEKSIGKFCEEITTRVQRNFQKKE